MGQNSTGGPQVLVHVSACQVPFGVPIFDPQPYVLLFFGCGRPFLPILACSQQRMSWNDPEKNHPQWFLVRESPFGAFPPLARSFPAEHPAGVGFLFSNCTLPSIDTHGFPGVGMEPIKRRRLAFGFHWREVCAGCTCYFGCSPQLVVWSPGGLDLNLNLILITGNYPKPPNHRAPIQ